MSTKSTNRDSGEPELPSSAKSADDPSQVISEEDKPTDYWVPDSASPPQGSAGPDKDFDEHIMELSRPLPRMGDTLIDDLPVSEVKAPSEELVVSPEQMKEPAPSSTVPSADQAAQPEPNVREAPPEAEDLDTVEMTPEEAAAMLAEMKERAKVMDAQGAGASPVQAGGEAGSDPGPTRRRADESHRTEQRADDGCDHPECRICGKKVLEPKPAHFRGPTSSQRGFRCEKCGIIICAKHTVRISGFFASLFGLGHFSCQLCQPSRRHD